MWWQKEVVYQVYPRSFKDSNHDGVGDLPGIIEKLDYLDNLGIDILWISPFFKSPMIDNGYDISDYYQVDPLYGTNEDLEKLIFESKKRGIKILFDLVVNHCSDQHEWFKKTIENPEGPESKYFILKTGQELNNWRAIFGGSVWSLLPGTKDTYYYHTFSKNQPDLNWENPQLRQEIYQMVNYWLEKGVAGFRVDAISYIKKKLSFPSFKPDGIDGLVSVNTGGNNQPGIERFLTELREQTFEKYGALTIGEAANISYDDLKKYVGPQGYFSMIFEFSYDQPAESKTGNWFEEEAWTVDEWKHKVYLAQKEIHKIGWSPTHIENHDGPRAVDKFFEEDVPVEVRAKMIATFYFFLRGTPFIYQGQEIGMTNINYSEIDKYNDLFTLDQYQRALNAGITQEEALKIVSRHSRDNARTPMQWSFEKNAGFSETKPWLDINENYKYINVKKQEEIKDSVLNYYKKMISLRKDYKRYSALSFGSFQSLFEEKSNLVAYERSNEGQRIWVITNFQKNKRTLILATKMKVLLDSQSKDMLEREIEGEITLKGYQSLVLEFIE